MCRRIFLDNNDGIEQFFLKCVIRFGILLCRQIDEAMATASAEEKMEEEAKGEYEIEREETVRWGIALEGIYAEEEEYAEMRSAMY